MMATQALIKALVATSSLLEDASDDEIDPDFAVKVLEVMAYELNKVEGSDRDAMLQEIEQTASFESNARVTSLIRQFPFSIGMVE